MMRGLSDTCREWLVLLDAAAYVSTNPLDLSVYPADFVSVSFYKMLGYPTGLGALLVRSDRSDLLQSKYFGGGTVRAYTSSDHYHVPKESLHQRYPL